MLHSTSIPYGAHQFATGQVPRRKPTIGAPDVMLAAQPSASLKRRSHIRRSSRTGTSPTQSTFTAPPQPLVAEPRPQLAPLVTAFTRTITASSTTLSPMTRRPTLMEPTTVEWRDAPRYQPNVSSMAELSRRSTVASVYSAPSGGSAYESRRSTQENYIVDWSFVDQALQNRSHIATPPSHSSQGFDAYSPSSSNPDLSRSNSCLLGPQAGLLRTNTTQVRSLLFERRRKRMPDSPLE